MTAREFDTEVAKISKSIDARRLYENYDCFWNISISSFKANYDLERLQNLLDNLDF